MQHLMYIVKANVRTTFLSNKNKSYRAKTGNCLMSNADKYCSLSIKTVVGIAASDKLVHIFPRNSRVVLVSV